VTTIPAAVSNAATRAAPWRAVNAGVHGATAVTVEVSAATMADSASPASTGGAAEGWSSACSARPNTASAGR
jgi:hypothetical protein